MSELNFNEIYNCDCIEGMRKIEDCTVDLIITDPPFAIDFKAKKSSYNRKKSNVIEGYNEVSSDEYYDFTYRWMSEASRILKDSGSIFIFSGWNNLKDILIAADKMELATVNHIIWKYQFGVCTKRRFVTSHYHCLYLCKNDQKRKFFLSSRFSQEDRKANGGSLQYQDLEDVWEIKREYWTGEQKTPTKLPAELIKKILMYTSEEGDIVLDPFLGSGQVAVLSKIMKRQFCGFEIVKEYYEFAKRRLDNDVYRLSGEAEVCKQKELADFN